MLTERLSMARKIKLNLGSGILLKKGFVNVDLYNPEELMNFGEARYVKADIRELPFKDNYADYVELFEVLEHIPMRDIVPALKEIRRVMKPKAMMRLHAPNFDGLMKDWLEVITITFDMQKVWNVMETIYGNQLADGEFHKTALNPKVLNYFLVEAGFKEGNIFVVPKGEHLPNFGSEKMSKDKVTRNELLCAEVLK